MVTRKSTKDLLIESFLDLSHEKSIDKITVKDISENCSLSRETFYYYFPDKFGLIDALYERGIYQPLENGLQSASKEDDLEKTFIEILHRIDEYPEVFSYVAQMKAPGLHINTFSDRIINIMGNHLKEKINTDKLPENIRFDLIFFIFAAINLIVEWIEKEEYDRMTGKDLIRKIFSSMPNDLSNIFWNNVQLR